jgi:NAD(P)-dependent dehydrogenase (short-subunit alcohol dehydrogenase family)
MVRLALVDPSSMMQHICQQRERPMDFRDRHVVVTGGTGALGTATVGALIEAGAICHVPYIDRAEADRFALRNHAKVELVGDIDLSQESAVAALYRSAPTLWASIHLAGGFAMAPVGETTKSDLMKQIEMNFVTAFLCSRAAVNTMSPNGAGGRIINVATRPALEWRTGAGMAAYTASKAAVAALTVALAEEVVKAGILVNAIAPSTMDTPANRRAMPNADHSTWAKVEDVAATILFLASPENRVTRGAVVPVYGRT